MISPNHVDLKIFDLITFSETLWMLSLTTTSTARRTRKKFQNFFFSEKYIFCSLSTFFTHSFRRENFFFAKFSKSLEFIFENEHFVTEFLFSWHYQLCSILITIKSTLLYSRSRLMWSLWARPKVITINEW